MSRQPKQATDVPTDGELAVLSVLWQTKGCTVREAYERVNASRPAGAQVGYTTVLKTLQIMFGKDLVTRDERDRSHIYYPAVPAQKTQRSLVRNLLNRAFGGSLSTLLVQALSDKKASAAELAEMKKLIDDERKRLKSAD